MRIIFATSDQFYFLWEKFSPQNRIVANIPAPNLVIPFLDTLVLLSGEGVELGAITNQPGEITFKEFIDVVRKRKFEPVVGVMEV